MLACLEDDRQEAKKQNLTQIMNFFSSVTCLLGEVYKLLLKIYGMVMIYRICSNKRRPRLNAAHGAEKLIRAALE